MKKKLFGLAALLLAALVFMGCLVDDDSDGDRKELTARSSVSVAATATTANVTFTGATGLTLSKGDFAVSAGGTISAVSVTSDTATVTVTFVANAFTSPKTYTVSIASASTKIKGSATVAITQAAVNQSGITAIPPAIPGDAVINLSGPVAPVVWLNGTITASVANYQEFIGFAWYIDGVQIAGQTSATLVTNARNYTLGTHSLTVITTKSAGKSYSKTVNFTIAKE
jgi:hypothetical protein